MDPQGMLLMLPSPHLPILQVVSQPSVLIGVFLILTSSADSTDTVYLLIFVVFLLYPIPFRTAYTFHYSFPPITKPHPNTKN